MDRRCRGIRGFATLVLGLAAALSACASSESAETESTENGSTQRATGSSKGSSDGESGSRAKERNYTDRPELKELEGETTRLEARAEIIKIKNKIQSYMLASDDDEIPDDLSTLAEGDNSVVKDPETLEDPWGHRYVLRTEDDGKLLIFSVGPDGEAGTEDDVRP